MALRVWLPLNGDLRNLGCSNITITPSASAAVQNSGKIGKCYCPATMNLTDFNNLSFDNSSFCFWAKTSSTASWQLIMGIDNASLSQIHGIYVADASRYKLEYNPSLNIYDAAISQWHHYAFVIKNGNSQAYYDGVLKTTSTEAVTNDAIGRIRLGVGTAISLNDVRIYDHCLSAAEVHEIAQGLVLHYKLDKIMYGNNNLLANSKLDGSWTYPASSYSDKYSPTTTIVPTGSQYTLSFDAKSTVNGDKIRTHYYSPNTTTTCISSQGTTKTASDGSMDFTLSTEWKKYWVIYTQTSTTAVKHIICPRIVSGYGTGTVSVKNVKLEEGTIPTAWCLPNEDSNTIEDSSGYGNNGIIVGDLIQNSETKRYSISTKWNCSSPTDNSDTGICYIQTPFSLTTPLQMSITWWAKPESGYGGSTNHAAFCTSNNTSRPTDYNTTAFHHRDAGFDIYPSDGSGVKRLSFTYTQNAWHHYAITYDGSTAKAYQDGVLKTSVTVGTNKTLASFSQLYIGYSQAGGARRKTLGSYSDFRIYCTALSEDDILQLYHTSAKVDNKQNLHAFELVESNSKISINKQGQTLCNELTEDTSTKFYKTNQIIETNEIIEL